MTLLREGVLQQIPFAHEGVQSHDSAAERARAMMESHLGQIVRASRLEGGLVHHVFSLAGEKGSAILKVRGTNAAGFPPDHPYLLTDPTDVRYEATALTLLSQLEPDVFPHLLAADADIGFLLMTDVIPERETLETELTRRTVTPEYAKALGAVAARTHVQLAAYDGVIRPDGEDIYRRRVQFTLGGQHGVLDSLVPELSEPHQLVINDMSPKNIGKGTDGQPTMCDLEFVVPGDRRYALSYLTAHILLHNLTDPMRARALVSATLKGIAGEDTGVDLNDPRFIQSTIGNVLFRLSPKVPYNVPYNSGQKQQLSQSLLQLLDDSHVSWETTFAILNHNAN